MKNTFKFIALAGMTAGILTQASAASGKTGRIGYATCFTVESCKREGTSGIMASGKKLADHAMLCALPGRPTKWGKRIRVTNLATGKSIVVAQMDIGPGKKARERGVKIDLSLAAFRAVGGKIKDGKLKVKIEKLDSRFHGNDKQKKD
jgi:rare lipoprotein A (peptidoglycan hydrolase)